MGDNHVKRLEVATNPVEPGEKSQQPLPPHWRPPCLRHTTAEQICSLLSSLAPCRPSRSMTTRCSPASHDRLPTSQFVTAGSPSDETAARSRCSSHRSSNPSASRPRAPRWHDGDAQQGRAPTPHRLRPHTRTTEAHQRQRRGPPLRWPRLRTPRYRLGARSTCKPHRPELPRQAGAMEHRPQRLSPRVSTTQRSARQGRHLDHVPS